MSKTYNRIVHEYKCLFLAFILLQIERESGKQNLGVKEKCPKVTYLIFLTGFHWRIFLLSRANRLCTVFNTGLKDLGSFVSQLVFLSLARSKMAIVRLPRALLKNYLTTIYFSEGKGTPLPFWGPSQSFGFSLFPLPMSGDLRSLKCEHLRDPHSFLTVTFWLLDTLIQYGGIVSVLPPRLREPSRDTSHTKKPFHTTPSLLLSYLLPKIYLHFQNNKSFMIPDTFDFNPTFPATTIPQSTLLTCF